AALQEEGYEELPVPSTSPTGREHREVSDQDLNSSDGAAAAEGTSASGPTPDGQGEFSDHDGPTTSAPMPPATQPDVNLHGTMPLSKGPIAKAAGAVKDALT